VNPIRLPPVTSPETVITAALGSFCSDLADGALPTEELMDQACPSKEGQFRPSGTYTRPMRRLIRLSMSLVVGAGAVLGLVATAPSASAGGTPAFSSSDLATWDLLSSPVAYLTANVGSTFTVVFPEPAVVVCAESDDGKPRIGCGSTLTVETTAGSVTPASGDISTSVVTTFTIVGSGTLTLRPSTYMTCGGGGGGCDPLTIRITAVGPMSLVSSDCVTWDGSGGTASAVSGHIGESFTVTFPNLLVAVGSVGVQSPGCPDWSFSSNPVATSPATGIVSTPDPITFTITGPGTVSFTVSGPASILTPLELTITISVLAGDPPPDVMQQVGAPSTGTCATFSDWTLNWAGAPSGGWGTSWAQWVNDGRGGVVCARSLYWQPSGRWSVRT
jgi:hypothetical protein